MAYLLIGLYDECIFSSSATELHWGYFHTLLTFVWSRHKLSTNLSNFRINPTANSTRNRNLPSTEPHHVVRYQVRKLRLHSSTRAKRWTLVYPFNDLSLRRATLPDTGPCARTWDDWLWSCGDVPTRALCVMLAFVVEPAAVRVLCAVAARPAAGAWLNRLFWLILCRTTIVVLIETKDSFADSSLVFVTTACWSKLILYMTRV